MNRLALTLLLPAVGPLAAAHAGCLEGILAYQGRDDFYVDSRVVWQLHHGAPADLESAAAELASDWEIRREDARLLAELSACSALWTQLAGGPPEPWEIARLRRWMLDLAPAATTSREVRSELASLLGHFGGDEAPLAAEIAREMASHDADGALIGRWLSETWLATSLAQALIGAHVERHGESAELLAVVADRLPRGPTATALGAAAIDALPRTAERPRGLEVFLTRDLLLELGALGLTEEMLATYEALDADLAAAVLGPGAQRPEPLGRPLTADADALALRLAFGYLAAGDPAAAEALSPGPEAVHAEPTGCSAGDSAPGDRECPDRSLERIAWRWLLREREGEPFDAFDYLEPLLRGTVNLGWATNPAWAHSWRQGAAVLASAQYEEAVRHWRADGARNADQWLAQDWRESVLQAFAPEVRRRADAYRERLAELWDRPRSVAWSVDDAATADGDEDGLPDAVEAAWGLDPAAADSDGDGLADGVDPAPRLFPTRRCDRADAAVATALKHWLTDDDTVLVVVAEAELADCLEARSPVVYLDHEEARAREWLLRSYTPLRIDLALVDQAGERAFVSWSDGSARLTWSPRRGRWKAGESTLVSRCGHWTLPTVPLPLLVQPPGF